MYFVSLKFGFKLCLLRSLFTSSSFAVLKFTNNHVFTEMSSAAQLFTSRSDIAVRVAQILGHARLIQAGA